MPRKPTVHDLEDPEYAGRVVRSDHRAAMDALKDMANQLAALSPGQRRALPLDAETLAELDRLAAAGHRPDRRRVLMRVKLLLADHDLTPVRAVLAGQTPAALAAQAADAWRARLVGGDDRVLQAFLDAHPGADRQALRTAAREARGESPAAKRAFQRLFKLLAEAVLAERARVEADDDDTEPDAADAPSDG